MNVSTHSRTVEIKALMIDGKGMSSSVFWQLPKATFMQMAYTAPDQPSDDVPEGAHDPAGWHIWEHGSVWGTVDVHNAECPPGHHQHVIFESDVMGTPMIYHGIVELNGQREYLQNRIADGHMNRALVERWSLEWTKRYMDLQKEAQVFIDA